MMDLLIANNRALFYDVKVIPSMSIDTDHRLVLAKLRIRKPKENRAKGAKRYKLGMLKEQDTIADLQQCMQIKLEDIVEQEGCNVDSMWSTFKECSMNSAQ